MSPQIRALIEQYRGDDATAFCLVTFDDGAGIRWPPEPDQRSFTLQRCIDHLRVAFVNAQYLSSYPSSASPVGSRMQELAGSTAATTTALEDFYDRGHSRVMVVRPRRDGQLMSLRVEHRVLRDGGLIVGHYGTEQDITASMVRAPDETLH